jgi:hypothetical protein
MTRIRGLIAVRRIAWRAANLCWMPAAHFGGDLCGRYGELDQDRPFRRESGEADDD